MECWCQLQSASVDELSALAWSLQMRRGQADKCLGCCCVLRWVGSYEMKRVGSERSMCKQSVARSLLASRSSTSNQYLHHPHLPPSFTHPFRPQFAASGLGR